MFRTPIKISKSNHLLDYDSKIMSFGSCFAENIAEKLSYYKFENSVNPFGIIFNAVSLEKIIFRIVNLEFYSENDVFFHNELWHCFEVHSDLNHVNQKEFLAQLNQIIADSRQELKAATHFIFTFGTSWVYQNKASNQIVANCHKVVQKEFSKELLTIETTTKSIENIILLIESLNENAKFIFTISPVRHIKDGFFENNVSKSVLFSSLYELLNNKNHNQNITYFPAYEIIVDELRDYRFYNEDMLHPNPLAITYIWQIFRDTHIGSAVFEAIEAVNSIQKSLEHKPFNENSNEYKKFLAQLHAKIDLLQKQYPRIKF